MRKIVVSLLFACALIACLILAGCKTPRCYEEEFARPFDAPRVAQLAHDSYKVVWAASFWAQYDLRTGAYHPTVLDREAIVYMIRLRQKVPWIARDIEKHPATPRCSSKVSYDMVAFDAKMLKARYQPTSFRPETGARIEKLLRMIDEISGFYELKNSETKGS